MRNFPPVGIRNSSSAGMIMAPHQQSSNRTPQPHAQIVSSNSYDHGGYVNQPVPSKLDPSPMMLNRLPPPATPVLPMYQPIVPQSSPYPFVGSYPNAGAVAATMNMAEEPEQQQSSVIAARFRTKLCRTFEEKGFCPYEEKCMFAHGEIQRRTTDQNLQDGIVTTDAIAAFQERERLAVVKAKLAQVSQRPPAILSASIRLGDREVGLLDAHLVSQTNGSAGDSAPRANVDAGPRSDTPTITFPLLLRRRATTSTNVAIEPSNIFPPTTDSGLERGDSQMTATGTELSSLEGPRTSESPLTPSGFITSQHGTGVRSMTPPTATPQNAFGDSLSAFESAGVTPSVSGCQQRNSASGSTLTACLAQPQSPMTPPPNQIAAGAREMTETTPQRGTPPQTSGSPQLLRGQPSAVGTAAQPLHRTASVHNPYLWRAL